jgi:hypothetical protein
LLIRLEQVRRGGQMQPIKFHVFDDADDFAPGVIAVIPNLLSEWVFVRPAAARQRFVDDEDGRRTLASRSLKTRPLSNRVPSASK